MFLVLSCSYCHENCVNLVCMLYLGMHGTSVLNIDCYWLNESVCEMPIGRSCDWYTSPKRELGDVGTTAGHNCVTLVWMLYLDIRGTSVLNIDCYWLNERVCVKCPLVRAVTDTHHLRVSWVMWGLQLDTWAQDAVWCGPLVTELSALKS